MKQLVITPDCPRCHGPLWAVPCPHLIDADGCSGEHFECPQCGVEWVYREWEKQWILFDAHGKIIETIPPQLPRFRRPK